MGEVMELPLAPNFQMFLEKLGDLEVTSSPSKADLGIHRRADYTVTLNGIRIGIYTVVGEGDNVTFLQYEGSVPGYANHSDGSDRVALYSSRERDSLVRKDFNELPFP